VTPVDVPPLAWLLLEASVESLPDVLET
jgi:hypothetical protein